MKSSHQTEKKDIQPINERIRASHIQLISHEGENVGIVSREEALKRAREVGLDLVQVTEKGSEGVPIAKIMDFGKELYARKKKQAEAKKHQKTIQIKEIKIRPKIGEHDFQTKMKRGLQFLKEGKHLKITLQFRGREMVTRNERGKEMFEKIMDYLQASGLEDNVVQEKESRAGKFWSRIYYLKMK